MPSINVSIYGFKLAPDLDDVDIFNADDVVEYFVVTKDFFEAGENAVVLTVLLVEEVATNNDNAVAKLEKLSLI